MTLMPGTRLGPYEIRAALGSGGMGEVYRAHDPRLGRDVAVKVLSEARRSNPDLLRRFEQEARAASALNHPNILTVLDQGSHEGDPFIVFEILEGDTLRARLSTGPLPHRRALDFALQIARGLGAAHEKGIVHRDLKPENVFVTRDARIKILDFGLAKLRPTLDQPGLGSVVETATAQTGPGVLLGTVGYMSPEQVQGRPADHRSDIFAFGAVLYEMLSGRRAFHRATGAETLSAILREDPVEITTAPTPPPPVLERLMRRCLEKDPAERFQSARDLTFALEAASAGSGSVPSGMVPSSPAGSAWRWRAAGLLVVVAALVAAFALGRRTAPRTLPEYELLTTRPGVITGARFTPDGASILFSAAWGAGPPRVFLQRRDNPEAGQLDLPPASLLSVSSKGEAAILLTTDRVYSHARGTLARVGLAGGTPRPVLDDVLDADWGPDGESLCVRRQVDGEWRLEFPIGQVLLREYTQFPRVSPRGDQVAFMNDDREIQLIDRTGRRRSLGGADLFVFGLAWGPGGDEVWATAGSGATDRAIWAIDLAGRRRLLARVAGALTLYDVAPDGRALVSTGFGHLGIRARGPGQPAEREIATVMRSDPVSLSGDGRLVLIRATDAGGPRRWGDALLSASDGSSSLRLGAGWALALSPDGRWALCLQGPPPQLVELPTGAGEARSLPIGALQPDGPWGPARWSPDGRTLFMAAREPGRKRRIFARGRDQADWKPVTPEGTDQAFVVSPEGRRLATVGPGGAIVLYSLDGSDAEEVSGTSGLTPVHWTADGLALYVRTAAAAPAILERLDIRTGRRQSLMELMPDDPAGVGFIGTILFTPAGSYVYGYNRTQGDLYFVKGLQ